MAPYKRKEHRCERCALVFSNQHELRRHTSVEHPTFRRCPLEKCAYTHRLLSMVRRHVAQAHGERSVVCEVRDCGLSMPFRQLRRHMRDKHCASVAKVQEAEENEVNGNNESRRQQNQLTTPANLPSTPPNKPISVALDDATSIANNGLKCAHCGKTQTTAIQLRRHIARVHERRYAKAKNNGGSSKKTHICAEEGCGKRFSTRDTFDDHTNRHKGLRPYVCERCARNFFARAEYARHLQRYHRISITALTRAINA